MGKLIARKGVFNLACIWVFVILLTGCGNTRPDTPKETEIMTVAEKRAEKEGETEDFLYLEKLEMEDLNEPKEKFEIYMPAGSEVDAGYGFYHQHGIYFSAFVNRIEGYEEFADYLDLMLEYLPGPDMDYADVYCSGILENEADRYFFYTGRGVRYDGASCEIRTLEYMIAESDGSYVNWSIELLQDEVDEETDLIIAELEACYGITLEAFKKDSPLKEGNLDKGEYAYKEGKNGLEVSEEYQYLGTAVLSDYDEKNSCSVMIPGGCCTRISNSHAYSFLHGVWITADVEEVYMGNLMADLKSSLDSKYESRTGDSERIRNVWKSTMLQSSEFEDAFYAVITYEKRGYDAEEYSERTEVLCYIPYDKRHYIALEIFLSDERYDDSTDAVIRELEQAYGIDLSDYDSGNGVGEEMLPDTVLWFNATYAPLTYSNGWNWKLVSGLEPTKENIEIEKYLLQQSWNVYDRETALEAAEWLKEEGHRNTCRECMEELEGLGLLDLEEKEFKRALPKAGLSDKAARYMIAYQMYQNGLDADDMAAWDLCRVNQLYAGFYVCGYMTYEEAMDASLANSLILQSLYSSWDEMMEGYLLGYRFWQGDLDTGRDSPTQERRRMYEMMLQMKDNPYLLDWDMQLGKSW